MTPYSLGVLAGHVFRWHSVCRAGVVTPGVGYIVAQQYTACIVVPWHCAHAIAAHYGIMVMPDTLALYCNTVPYKYDVLSIYNIQVKPMYRCAACRMSYRIATLTHTSDNV